MKRDPAVIGVQKCGCVTYANSRPDLVTKDDLKAMNQIRKTGGEIVTTTVFNARRRKNFLPAECPHEPQGWKRAAQ